ncbi:MAG: hypothetical protein V4707_02820 [Pseudomonadota bacterium]
MRPLILAVPALLLLSACAGTAGPDGSYSEQLARLNADCVARGGVLSPTGATTGRVETENVCRINGVAARAGR